MVGRPLAEEELVERARRGDDTDASWSPDGTRILFDSTRDGNREVYVMNADGSGARNLTRNPAEDFADTWR